MPGRIGLEPRLVRRARDRVELAAERGDPPGVDHVEVGRGDVELDRLADRARAALSTAMTPFGYVKFQ